MKISEVTFPVYKMPNGKITREGTVVIITNDHGRSTVLDDTSLYGSFGSRRIKLGEKVGEKLVAKLKKGFPTIQSLVVRSKDLYVDSNGKLFNYVPSVTCKITYYPVVSQVVRKQSSPLAYLKGYPTPVKIPMPLSEDSDWYLGIGVYEGGTILFDISDTMKKKTWRKI